MILYNKTDIVAGLIGIVILIMISIGPACYEKWKRIFKGKFMKPKHFCNQCKDTGFVMDSYSGHLTKCPLCKGK